MEKNNFLKNFTKGKSEFSTNMLRNFYNKMVKCSYIPHWHRSLSRTPERVASDYLEYLITGAHIGSYLCTLLLTHEFENNGKTTKLSLEQLGLSDYEISYLVTKATVEVDNEIVSQTTIGNNIFCDIKISEIMEYARIMYGEEAYTHLMEHSLECLKRLPYVPDYPSYDFQHASNGRKFKRAFKKDALAKKILKEVKELNKELDKYNSQRKAIDILNDDRKEKFNSSIVSVKQPVTSKSVYPKQEKITQKERD